MKLTPIVEHLQRHCPALRNYVYGAADLTAAEENNRIKTTPNVFVGCVILIEERAEPKLHQGSAKQEVNQFFDVVITLANPDQVGQKACDQLSDIRYEIQKALVGWRLSKQHYPVEYEGAELTQINHLKLSYAYHFKTGYTLTDTYDESADLPEIKKINVDTDVIDPIADPNRKKPGPDKRIEFQDQIEF